MKIHLTFNFGVAGDAGDQMLHTLRGMSESLFPPVLSPSREDIQSDVTSSLAELPGSSIRLVKKQRMTKSVQDTQKMGMQLPLNLYSRNDDNNTRVNKLISYAVNLYRESSDLTTTPLIVVSSKPGTVVPRNFTLIRVEHIFVLSYPPSFLWSHLRVQFVSVYVIKKIQRFFRMLSMTEKTTKKMVLKFLVERDEFEQAVVKNSR